MLQLQKKSKRDGREGRGYGKTQLIKQMKTLKANVDASEREDSGSEGLQREFTREEVLKCVAKLENRLAAGADQIVDEFFKYGGERMLTMMVLLYNWIWKNQYAPRWGEGVVVNLFKKGDKADPGNDRWIPLLRTVGKNVL